MKISQILSLATTVVEALVNGGVKVPPAILGIISDIPVAINEAQTATSVLPSVASIVTSGSFANPTAIVNLGLKAVGVSATGIAAADAAIAEIATASKTVSADLANLIAGQAVSLASDVVHIEGNTLHVHIVAVVSGGPAATALGL